MSIKYDSKREPLAEIIKKATVNATYVIPDLQRLRLEPAPGHHACRLFVSRLAVRLALAVGG